MNSIRSLNIFGEENMEIVKMETVMIYDNVGSAVYTLQFEQIYIHTHKRKSSKAFRSFDFFER